MARRSMFGVFTTSRKRQLTSPLPRSSTSMITKLGLSRAGSGAPRAERSSRASRVRIPEGCRMRGLPQADERAFCGQSVAIGPPDGEIIQRKQPATGWSQAGPSQMVEVVGVEPTSSYPYVVTSTCVASSLITIAFGDEHPCDLSVFSLTPEITAKGGDRPR